MAVASIQSRFRANPDSETVQVVFTLTSDQSTKTIDLITYGFTNYGTNAILSIDEFSAIPGTGANRISSSVATLSSGLTLTINNSTTRLIIVTGR